jgi:hypothetical protein
MNVEAPSTRDVPPQETPPAIDGVHAKRKARDRKMMPVILSAGICPGLGQWVQSRRVVGVLYLVGTLAFFVRTMIEVGRPCMQTASYIQRIRVEEPVFNWRAIFGYFTLTVLVYLLNVLDVWVAQRRRKAADV